MRWQNLFSDLEAQLLHQDGRELLAEVPDRTRRERAEVRWSDRAAASLGHAISVSTSCGVVTGRLEDLGRDWLLLEEIGRRTALVPASAVLGLSGAAARAETGEQLGRRFGLGVALRAISRDRSPVVVHDAGGGQSAGTIDVVGADYLELAEHPIDLPRRREHVTGQRLVPFAALVVLRRG